MMVIVPLVGEPPLLLGTSVYVPVLPTVKLPLCDFVRPSVGGAARMLVGSLAVAVLVAPPPDAVAVLITVPGLVAVTLILMSTLGSTEAGGMTALDVQVTTCPACEHAHDVPVPDTYVRPAGSVSTIVIGPVVGPSPVFATESV